MSVLKKVKSLRLPFKVIELATENFKECIGKGGYGMVYKGELTISGRTYAVAVKKLKDESEQGLKEFLTEVQLLAGLNHKNVISLLGYCEEGMEKSLVYQYAAHGSLDTHIRNRDASFTWQKRLEICLDAARGLNHLHSNSRKKQTIIHRDIKSANILIDQNWVGKISDLGLSKLTSETIVVSNACGTIGYCDPEYMNGILKKDIDVYSFGMVLFEVLCGKLCMLQDENGFKLTPGLAKDYYKRNRMSEIVDPSLREQLSSYSINKFSEVAYRCMLEDERQRLSMNRVVIELEELLLFLKIKLRSTEEVRNLDSDSYDSDPVNMLRFEKVKRIFQRFDVNRDGVLNRSKLADYFRVTDRNFSLSEEKINSRIDNTLRHYGTKSSGDNVLTCDGMLQAYSHGVDKLQEHFELLQLELKHVDDNEVDFRTTERYEKVKRILQRFDFNRDGWLNTEELTMFLGFHDHDNIDIVQDLMINSVNNNIDNIICVYGEFINGEKGLTCDGLFKVYDFGIDKLEVDFERLRLDLKPYDETYAALRYEKVRRVFERFDINGDGGLNREELAELFVVTQPSLKNDEEQLNRTVQNTFSEFSEFTDGEKGLTCEGLLHNYDYGIDILDDCVDLLRLDLTPLDDSEVASRKLKRFEKVKRIFEKADHNNDGGLNRDELLRFFYKIYNSNVETSTERTNKMRRLYGEFIDGEKGLTCHGLLRSYDHGIDRLDADFDIIELRTSKENEAALKTSNERYDEKVRKIFQRFDINRDGGLNREELLKFVVVLHAYIALSEEKLNNAVDDCIHVMREFIDEVVGLTCEGMLRMYEIANGHDLDRDFELLKLR